MSKPFVEILKERKDRFALAQCKFLGIAPKVEEVKDVVEAETKPEEKAPAKKSGRDRLAELKAKRESRAKVAK